MRQQGIGRVAGNLLETLRSESGYCKEGFPIQNTYHRIKDLDVLLYKLLYMYLHMYITSDSAENIKTTWFRHLQLLSCAELLCLKQITSHYFACGKVFGGTEIARKWFHFVSQFGIAVMRPSQS